jgi:uncharacterized protein YcfJ
MVNSLTLKFALISLMTTLSVNSYGEQNFHYDYATVLQVQPIVHIVEVEDYQQQCRKQQVTERSSNGKNKLLGSLIGAAVGHALGSRSKHRKQATIVGAITGATIAGGKSTNSSEQVICEPYPVASQEERIVGYKVIYRYNDRTFETRLDYDPGNSLKLRVLLSPMYDNDQY